MYMGETLGDSRFSGKPVQTQPPKIQKRRKLVTALIAHGILTLLFEVTPVGMAPPSGLMKLLVAPESRTASFPIWYFTALVGSLNIFLNLSSLFSQSAVSLGVSWMSFSGIVISVKLAWGSRSSHVGRAGFHSGGPGRSQVGSMLEFCPPQTRPPSETWQDSSAACSLLSTAV